MKKHLFLFAAAAIALASCSSDDTIAENSSVSSNQQKEISLFAVNQKATRAAGAAEYNAVEAAAYPQNYNMKVVAYSVPVTGTAGNYFGSATADGGVLFSYQFAGGASNSTANASYWGGNPAQYWPLSPATLNFLAVSKGGSPTADVVSPQFNANYASGVTVTLSDNKPQAATTGIGQQDLMYAFGRAQVTQSSNTISFPEKVDMTFQHALAWVVFRVKANTSGVETAITINKITLNGAKYAGTFTAAVNNYEKAEAEGTDDDLSWGTCQWTAVSGEAANCESPNYNPTTLTTSFSQVGDGLLIVPQGSMATPAAAFTSFTIEYVLNGNTYEYTYTPAENDRKLLMDKKYIYDITFQLHEIFVNASVDTWTGGGTTSLTIQ